MAAEIVTASIATFTAIVMAGPTYWFTKKRERDAEIRKEKLEHYKEFVTNLSSVISGESTPDDKRAFSRACNKLNLVAPQIVIKALQDFQQEIKDTNESRSDEHSYILMSRLFSEMRKDLGITPKDADTDFIFRLWDSGIHTKNSSHKMKTRG